MSNRVNIISIFVAVVIGIAIGIGIGIGIANKNVVPNQKISTVVSTVQVDDFVPVLGVVSRVKGVSSTVRDVFVTGKDVVNRGVNRQPVNPQLLSNRVTSVAVLGHVTSGVS
jgi:hypothetical protein